MSEGKATGSMVGAATAAALNPGTALDLARVDALGADVDEIERRVAALASRPRPTGDERVASLLRAVESIDLTSLSGDDTPDRIRELCDAARRPIGAGILENIGWEGAPPTTAAVCVYPVYVETAREALAGTTIPVATVAAAFPHGLSPLSTRIAEVRACRELGASEIDIVIRRSHALLGDWAALYDEVRAFREAAGDAHLKAILATGELGSVERIAKAGLVALMAGADFIKTSTGKESVNATLEAGVAMARAIRAYHEQTGFRAGLKPAGGIRTADQALDWLALVEEELGTEWLGPDRFRIGASSLLGDIVRELASRAG